MVILNLSNREKVLIIFLVLAISVSVFLLYTTKEETAGQDVESLFQDAVQTETDPVVPKAAEEKVKVQNIIVDVKGAVHKPGVYEMALGNRVIDAIEVAGGLLDEADRNGVNLALQLEDEMVIYVPAFGEAAAEPVVATASEDDGKVNINKADEQALQQLPGVGPSKAKAIISYREEHGPFKSENDLLHVSGIGEKSLEKISEQIIIR